MKSTWSVVATVDEPPVLIQLFVAWYLHLGASEVILYFDRPDDPATAMMRALPNVRVVLCDAAHWARLGKRRPQKHQTRQLHNATDAYRTVRTDWLLHCDADEYVLPQRRIGYCLSEVPTSFNCATLPVAERVFEPDSAGKNILTGGFRRPFHGKPDAARALFGPHYRLSQRGLTGHVIGKAFSRVGQGFEVSIHRPSAQGAEVPAVPLSGVELLHFDGLTQLHWVYKLLRKADAFLRHNGMSPSQHRQRQIDAILADAKAGYEIHDQLKRADPALIAQLHVLGLWLEAEFDPWSALEAVFPGDRLDLSTQAFDAWLWDHKGEVLRGYGLQPKE